MGTLVVMAHGRSMPIADVQVGDRVVTADPTTGATTRQYRTPTLVFNLTVSSNHTFFVREGSGLNATYVGPAASWLPETAHDVLVLNAYSRPEPNTGR